MKDIIIFLPSRSSPKKCNDTIHMLYETCSNKENFDILCIVDEDEIELYSSLKKKYPDIIWEHPPHVGPNSSYINKIIYETVENSDYYFNWYVTDDFYGLSKNWDLEIKKVKEVYDDGFYTLFESSRRNLNALAGCFKAPAAAPFNGRELPLVKDPAQLIYHYHEMMPIMTKKWRMALRKFYSADFKGPDIVFLNAALVYVLNLNYGYSRNIQVNLTYGGIADDNNASKVLYEGLTRDQYYFKFAQTDNFKIIKPVARFVAISIWKHYRQIMDKICNTNLENKIEF